MRDESAVKPVESLARLYSPATDVPSCSDASVPVACAACPGQTRNRCKPEINQAGRHVQGKWERGGQEGNAATIGLDRRRISLPTLPRPVLRDWTR